MIRILFASVLALGLASCATGDLGPDAGSTLPRHEEDTEPVGSYLGGDEVTWERVYTLMHAHGIEVMAYGSLGYTIAVPVSRAEEARRLLADAIAHDGLQADVYTAADLERSRATVPAESDEHVK